MRDLNLLQKLYWETTRMNSHTDMYYRMRLAC